MQQTLPILMYHSVSTEGSGSASSADPLTVPRAVIDDLTARFAERTGLAVTCEHSGAAPAIDHAAATQVLRVVQEALQNVEKHARARAVLVASEAGDGVLRVLVRDDGVGIPSEMLPTIFEMFAQVGRPVNRSRGGLGIGLTLSLIHI